MASNVTRAAFIGGKVEVKDLVIDAFGNALGSSLGYGASNALFPSSGVPSRREIRGSNDEGAVSIEEVSGSAVQRSYYRAVSGRGSPEEYVEVSGSTPVVIDGVLTPQVIINGRKASPEMLAEEGAARASKQWANPIQFAKWEHPALDRSRLLEQLASMAAQPRGPMFVNVDPVARARQISATENFAASVRNMSNGTFAAMLAHASRVGGRSEEEINAASRVGSAVDGFSLGGALRPQRAYPFRAVTNDPAVAVVLPNVSNTARSYGRPSVVPISAVTFNINLQGTRGANRNIQQLELFTGPSGPQVVGARGVGPTDPTAILSDARNLSGIATGSQARVIANNPFIPPQAGGTFHMMDYLPEAARVTTPGGQIIINGNSANKYFTNLPNQTQLDVMNIRIQYQGPLQAEFHGMHFTRTDGSPINPQTMQSIVFTKKP